MKDKIDIKQITNEKYNDFFKHTKNYVSIDFVIKILSFLSLAIISRVLTREELGIVSLFTSSVTIITILAGLNIRGGIKRYYFEHRETFPEMLGTNLVFIICYNLIFLSTLLLLRRVLSNFFGISEYVFFFVCIISGLKVFFEIYLSYLQGSKASRRYAILTAIRNSGYLTLYIILIFVLVENKYLGSVYAEVVSAFIICAYALWRLTKLSKLEFKLKYLKYALVFGIPLIPHSLSGFILAYFDRIIINDIEGLASTGVYSMAYQIGMIVNIIVLAANKSWQPIFYEEKEKENYSKINQLANTYSNMIYLLGILLVLFTKEIYFILIDPKFYDGMNIVPVITVSYMVLLLYTFYSHYALYKKKTFLVSVSTFIAGGTNIALNYWLIPIYGYHAAAYTTLISYLVLFILHYINAKVILKEEVIPLKAILPNFILITIVIFIYSLINTISMSYVILLLIKIIIAGACTYYLLFSKRKII